MPSASRWSTTSLGSWVPRDEPRMVPPWWWMRFTTSGVSGIGSWPKRETHALVAVAKAEDPLHAVAVRELEHDAAHHVVEPGAEAAAGDDPAAERARIEEDLVARPRELEGRQVQGRPCVLSELGDAVVDEHLVGPAHEGHGGLAQVRGDGRGEQALSEHLDARRPPS